MNHRIEMLINDLIEEGNVATASLASILVAAQGAVAGGYDVALCRHVWMASLEYETGLQDSLPQPDADEFIGRTCQS
ncbi:hypothetical protein [Singulisphaera acidiphila]|uniref:hypothetical protein n=1 Tax=Singulisphaera acidiphila TaxID=466153 RepID=UPI0012B5DCC3|nr:hypothetical protein [Singulisphaera acidiphila]